MKVESYQKIAAKTKRIREILASPISQLGKIDDIKAKIDSINKNKDTHNKLVTLNISPTVIEVDSDTALQLLQSALDTEIRLAELYQWRMRPQPIPTQLATMSITSSASHHGSY